MKTEFQPLADRVLVLPKSEPVKTGGLAKPKQQEEEPTQGVVVAAGPKALHIPAKITRCDGHNRMESPAYNLDGVSIGETIQWAKYSGRDVMHLGVKHKLLRLEEIEGRIVEVVG